MNLFLFLRVDILVVASVVDVDVFLLVSVSAAALAQSLPASTSGAVCRLVPARLRRVYRRRALIRRLVAVCSLGGGRCSHTGRCSLVGVAGVGAILFCFCHRTSQMLLEFYSNCGVVGARYQNDHRSCH